MSNDTKQKSSTNPFIALLGDYIYNILALSIFATLPLTLSEQGAVALALIMSGASVILFPFAKKLPEQAATITSTGMLLAAGSVLSLGTTFHTTWPSFSAISYLAGAIMVGMLAHCIYKNARAEKDKS